MAPNLSDEPDPDDGGPPRFEVKPPRQGPLQRVDDILTLLFLVVICTGGVVAVAALVDRFLT